MYASQLKSILKMESTLMTQIHSTHSLLDQKVGLDNALWFPVRFEIQIGISLPDEGP